MKTPAISDKLLVNPDGEIICLPDHCLVTKAETEAHPAMEWTSELVMVVHGWIVSAGPGITAVYTVSAIVGEQLRLTRRQ